MANPLPLASFLPGALSSSIFTPEMIDPVLSGRLRASARGAVGLEELLKYQEDLRASQPLTPIGRGPGWAGPGPTPGADTHRQAYDLPPPPRQAPPMPAPRAVEPEDEATYFFPKTQPPMQAPESGLAPDVDVTAQRRPTSQAAMWGLLAAGLGILANNYGRYGQAGPAIGLGGLTGLETFLGQRQQEEENLRRQQLADQQGEYQRGQLNIGERGVKVREMQEQREAQAIEQKRALALALAGGNTDQQAIAVADADGFIKFKLGQLSPDYKERSIKEGTQAYDEYTLDGGKTWAPVPGGGKYDLRAAKGGSNITMQGAVEDFNKKSLEKQAESLMATYDTLKNIPDQIQAMDAAEKALAGAGGFVGQGAETKLAIAKFFNNNFGTQIGAEEIANAELLRSSLFRQIMENLRKLDAQPAKEQQRIMQEALGTLTTDPAAIPKIIAVTRQALATRAKEHNRRVKQAKENKAIFLYDITIPGFEEQKQPWE